MVKADNLFMQTALWSPYCMYAECNNDKKKSESSLKPLPDFWNSFCLSFMKASSQYYADSHHNMSVHYDNRNGRQKERMCLALCLSKMDILLLFISN